MKVVLSNPLEMGRTGAGRPYGQLVDYFLHGQTKHEVKFVSGFELVKALYGDSPKHPESLEQGSMSDLLASVTDLDCDVFLGAGCASLSQIREIKHHSPHSNTTKVITSWFSTHYRNAEKVLSEAGIRDPIDKYLMWRDYWEQKWSDALIVPSKVCADTYEADEECKGKTKIVSFGVDSQAFHPPAAEEAVKGFKVMFTGGNWVRKGLPYLIEAWNQLRLTNALLTVVGANYNTSAWRTNYAGWVPDEQVPEYYRRHNVFVLPTLEEGSALAVLEAMASGCCVITTKEAGSPIETLVDGIIIPSKDVEALKKALAYLYQQPEQIDLLGIAARAKAESLTWQKFGESVMKVCEEVASK